MGISGEHKITEIGGFILINKPVGPTSHDIIDKLRRITGIKKIGHAGTLDPFASGLMIVAIGRAATKQLQKFVKLDKEYTAVLYLGADTDTYDKTGRILSSDLGFVKPKIADIKKILKKFQGRQTQIPPMYSAKKIKGKKLYELARAGIEIKREPVEIKVYDIKINKYKYPKLEIAVKCSSGTYIRALAHDIGRVVGCGAYLDELKRTAIGKYRLNNAAEITKIDKDNWQEKMF